MPKFKTKSAEQFSLPFPFLACNLNYTHTLFFTRYLSLLASLLFCHSFSSCSNQQRLLMTLNDLKFPSKPSLPFNMVLQIHLLLYDSPNSSNSHQLLEHILTESRTFVSLHSCPKTSLSVTPIFTALLDTHIHHTPVQLEQKLNLSQSLTLNIDQSYRLRTSCIETSNNHDYHCLLTITSYNHCFSTTSNIYNIGILSASG